MLCYVWRLNICLMEFSSSCASDPLIPVVVVSADGTWSLSPRMINGRWFGWRLLPAVSADDRWPLILLITLGHLILPKTPGCCFCRRVLIFVVSTDDRWSLIPLMIYGRWFCWQLPVVVSADDRWSFFCWRLSTRFILLMTTSGRCFCGWSVIVLLLTTLDPFHSTDDDSWPVHSTDDGGRVVRRDEITAQDSGHFMILGLVREAFLSK